MEKKKNKKGAGRPALPENEVKRRASIRLSNDQKEIVYAGLDKSLGLQAAIDTLIEGKRQNA